MYLSILEALSTCTERNQTEIMEREPNMQTTSIWVLLNVAHKQIIQTFETELKRKGLPPVHWYEVLRNLEMNPQGMRQNELQTMSLYSQVNLSPNVKKMIEEGLVKQTRAEDDGRGRVLTLTDDGVKMRKRMWEIYGGLMVTQIEDRMPSDIVPYFVRGLRCLVSDVDWPIE
jgi:DNA-binding MarR family transcriptional regulator